MPDSNTMDNSLMNFDLTPEKVKTNIKENAEYLQKIEKRELLEYIKNRIQRFAKNSSELKLKFNVEANKKAKPNINVVKISSILKIFLQVGLIFISTSS